MTRIWNILNLEYPDAAGPLCLVRCVGMEIRKLEKKSLEENLRRSIRSSPTGPIDGPLIKEIAAQGKNHYAIDLRKR